MVLGFSASGFSGVSCIWSLEFVVVRGLLPK